MICNNTSNPTSYERQSDNSLLYVVRPGDDFNIALPIIKQRVPPLSVLVVNNEESFSLHIKIPLLFTATDTDMNSSKSFIFVSFNNVTVFDFNEEFLAVFFEHFGDLKFTIFSAELLAVRLKYCNFENYKKELYDFLLTAPLFTVFPQVNLELKEDNTLLLGDSLYKLNTQSGQIELS